jgi:hypothetical protein
MSKRFLAALIVLSTTAVFSTAVTTVNATPRGGDHHDDDDDDDDASCDDAPPCYAMDLFPSERLRLDVEKHSKLNGHDEVEVFDHAKQKAYSVHGKEIGGCGAETTMAVTGTVVTARAKEGSAAVSGAIMGIEMHAARSAPLECRSATFDCTTTEISATPDVWTCGVRNEFDINFGTVILTKVNAAEDPLCSFFGNPTTPPERGVVSAKAAAQPALGLRKKLPRRR